MYHFLVRRILGALVILLIITAVTFFLFFAIPRDPARLACGKICPPETLELVRHNMGIDEPVFLQYWHWLAGIFAGREFTYGHCDAPCLGYSFVNQEPIFDAIVDRFPTTLSLTIGAAVVFLLFGVGTGMIAAARRGRAADKIASSASLVGASMQIYFVGVLATWVLVDRLRVLERPAYHDFTADPFAWAGGLLLPWLVLSIIFTANYTRMTRSSMVEQLSEDYVRTARAKGMSSRTVFLRFAWRGAMGPIITIFGVDLGTLLGGAIITEQTFSLHGIGELSIKAVVNQDLPMLLGVVLVSAAAIVVFNIVVDAAYAVIDPRVRLS
ncbi:peptide/nickel transport system permease protein [Thermocatellispora tengchongensis]|uniref:Peptide/nickel transport system permease protein n=1 Tax=Thermocatellispora tengchongensis TaxID=1073253 RepID=A0A840P351_9ACTN|nr:ABC transporter permease [Thermocatellispora tengchongensis]MBB5131677.1 peptide/nickel transport system permease protein [Thermocatellispora tengchongensis]